MSDVIYFANTLLRAVLYEGVCLLGPSQELNAMKLLLKRIAKGTTPDTRQ